MTTLTHTTGHWPSPATSDPQISSSRARTALLWIAQIAAAGMFLFTGTLKLSGAEVMVQMFGMIGIGQWFRYLTGGIEVVAAVMLLVPSLAFFGALVLAVTMVGAVLTHLFIVGGSFAPAGVLLVTTAGVAWARRRTW